MNITIDTKKGEEVMSLDEFCRWMCLVEAFDFIEKKAEEMGLNVSNFIKPLAIEEYVKERFPSLRHDVGCEVEMGLL